MRVRGVLVGAPFGPVDRPVQLPREQAERHVVRVEADLVAEAAADVLRDEAKLVDPGPQRGRHPDRADARHLVIAVQRPLARRLLVLDERTGALERRRAEAVEVELVDRDDPVRLGLRALPVAPVEDAAPDRIRARVVVHDGVVLDGLARVDQHVERLVLDLDELGGVARQLAGGGADGGDRLAHEAHLADGERVVLDLVPRRRRQLEERVGLDRDLVAGQRPVDAVERERCRNVDRDDLRVRVRRADEVDVAHSVPAHVVEEDPLALDEPLVLLARDRLADVALLQLDRCGGRRLGRAHAFSPTETIASTMLT